MCDRTPSYIVERARKGGPRMAIFRLYDLILLQSL